MGVRLPLGLRVTKDLKRKLNEATYTSGRSQSQEAEFRLEQTFDATRTLFDALDLAYGRRWTGILLALAQAAQMTGTRCMAVNHWNFEGGEDWALDPFAYDQAVKAITTVLAAFRPKGKIEIAPVSDFARLPVSSVERLGEDFARDLLEQLRKPNDRRADVEIVRAIVRRLSDMIPSLRLASKNLPPK